MSLTGAVTVLLPEVTDALYDQQRHDRKQLMMLDAVPDNASVTINIGDRQYVSADAATWIHQHIDRLHITIDGTSPKAVAAFVNAARRGVWSVVA